MLDGIGDRYGRKSEKPAKNGVVTWLGMRRGLKGEQSRAAFVKQRGGGGNLRKGEKVIVTSWSNIRGSRTVVC